MFESSRHEYSVKTCPTDEAQDLEDLLNEMSEAGWELYSLHESESKKGGIQYNCIFYREVGDDEDENEVVEIDDFKTRMEKMFHPYDEPYRECQEIQRRMVQKQEEIVKIKDLLESTTDEINHKKLNEEISRNLKELDDLKIQFADAIDPVRMFDRVNQDKLTIIISDELLNLVDTSKNGELISETVNLRQQLTDNLGYVIPAMKFTNSEILEANEYRINVRGLKVFSSIVYPGYRRFYVNQLNLDRKPKDAIDDVDTITGEEAFWLEEVKTKNFWEKGLTPAQVITNNLENIVCRYVDEILDYSDINNYIDIVSNQNLYLVENLIPDYLSVGDLRYIFAGLIREKVSVKDLIYIFEKLNDLVQQTVEKEILIEKIRISLGRQISGSIADENGNIYGIEITDHLGGLLEELLVEKDEKFYFDPKNPKISKLVKKVVKIIKDNELNISNTAIITPAIIRQQVFELFEQLVPGLSVASKSEITGDFNLETIEAIKDIK